MVEESRIFCEKYFIPPKISTPIFSLTGVASCLCAKSCRTCGGGLFSEVPEWDLVDIYPNVVPDMKHEPTVHAYYSERTISIKDGLPKFKDLPKEFGGSGETLPE